jgi:transcriptional regulator of stress and heat shock response
LLFIEIYVTISMVKVSQYFTDRPRSEKQVRLSDTIEQFIKDMISEEPQAEVDLKRNELAAYFHCAPSQINYVLSTRFTPDHGYVTSSQRGGGGYIRIVRIVRGDREQLAYLLSDRIGSSITAAEAQVLSNQLAERGVISAADAQLMTSATSAAALSVPVTESVKDAMRARILRSMLLTVAQRRKEAGAT